MRVRTVISIGLLLSVLISCALSGATMVPATTVPSTLPASGARLWFNQLADLDPEVREQARINLMGLSRRELPELARIVKESRPLRPSQISELHDIVTQAYLREEPYPRDPENEGFLGVRWPALGDVLWDDPPGLVIDTRIKGFCGYQVLQDGDVLVDVVEAPGAVTDRMEFARRIRALGAGTRVTLRVLRGGRLLDVPIKLDVRPAWADGDVNQIESLREKKTEQYWEETFATLIGEAVTSAGK